MKAYIGRVSNVKYKYIKSERSVGLYVNWLPWSLPVLFASKKISRNGSTFFSFFFFCASIQFQGTCREGDPPGNKFRPLSRFGPNVSSTVVADEKREPIVDSIIES